MIERAFIVGAVLAATLVVALGARAGARWRVAQVLGQPVPAVLRRRLSRTRPNLVYFFGPHCGTCAQQKTVLDELDSEGAAHIIALDATQERALADRLGALTIPATAFLDRSGRLAKVNLGYQPRSVLIAQMESMLAG
ncbi:MAG TPA: thioredoxin family protein [Chloroflexota bacterium]|jgi:thiol-disulfide isomerase/thioredoxin